MNEGQFYKVTVYSPVGIREVNAIGIGGVKEVHSRKDGSNFQMEVTLEGKVIFHCDDYEYFKTLSDSERRYDDVKATISIYCAGAYSVKWRTFIEIRKGEFDLERKTFSCSFSLENVNRTFEQRKSDTFNIYELVPERLTTTAQYVAGIIYDNGVPLYKALLAMFREVLVVANISSDFFNWNTSGSFIIGNNAKLQNQGIFHKSDIVKASSAGYAPATIMNLSLADTIDNLCNLYNLRWTLDAAGNFRIEHVSWFSRGAGLDITVPRYAEYLKGTKDFTFDEPKIFRVEKFTNEQSINKDFVGEPIRYDNALIKYLKGTVGHIDGTDRTEDVLERRVDFITDIDAIYGNIGTATQSTADRGAELDGIVLLALDASGNIQKVNGILETSPAQRNNNVNSWAVLQEDYWKSDRLFAEGIMNGTLHAFDSVQRIKIRKTIVLPYCCDDGDPLNPFNANDLVGTEFGDALINKASFDVYRSTLELELAYIDEETVTLGGPNTVPDIYATNVSTALNTSTAGKPSLLANDGGVTSVLAETKTTTLGGSVIIATNGHFIYTPPAGIYGIDVFDYVGLDGAGRVDIGTAKVIIKAPGIYIHADRTQWFTNIYSGTTLVGWTLHWIITIRFYEDPLLQIPIDLTGYGIIIPYSFNVYAYTGSTTPLASGSGTINPATGTFAVISSSQFNGFGPRATGAIYPVVITSSSSYTIV